MKASQKEHEEAAARLRELLPPGSTVYTILRHVSRSGMLRHVSCYTIADGEPVWLDGYVAKVTGFRRVPGFHDALKVTGCGMDAGFHVVYELSHALYPAGAPCIGEKCRSNDHSNGDHDYRKHTKRHPHIHRDGGYALNHRWM